MHHQLFVAVVFMAAEQQNKGNEGSCKELIVPPGTVCSPRCFVQQHCVGCLGCRAAEAAPCVSFLPCWRLGAHVQLPTAAMLLQGGKHVPWLSPWCLFNHSDRPLLLLLYVAG